jgi:NADH-quinone oxidoreductase subunit D
MTTKIPLEIQSLTSDEYILNMGPQHPSTHGVLRFALKMDGEVVKDVVTYLGYMHRGMEKMFENKKYEQIIPYTDRTDYLSVIPNNWVYCMAVEKLMGIQVPERAQYLRVIMAEINRIMSHLLWYASFGMDVGALTPIWYAFKEREELMALMESASGARFLHNYFRFGGFKADIPKGFIDGVKKVLDRIDGDVDEYEALLINNVILTNRTKGVAPISREKAIEYGLSGPSIRGSNIVIDVRKDEPYGVYSKFNFEIPVGNNGDTWDRCKVRMDEIRQSAAIIRQAIETLPAGEVMAKVPKVIKPAPGEVYTRVEGPRGDIGLYLVSDGSDKPYRIKMRMPSFSNLSAIKELIIGYKVADVVAILGSLDVIIPEIDR